MGKVCLILAHSVQVAVGEGVALVVADNWEESWFSLVDSMSTCFGPQSWAVLLLGITLLPLVQQVKHRPAAKLGRAEWFTALQEGYSQLASMYGWRTDTAGSQLRL